jgi:hypothetical protein
MLCPVCHQRKPRRACPALSRDICTVCCGTKRLKEIHCPPDCIYLAAAREHPAAVERRLQETDLRVFLPTVQDLNERQSSLLWVVLSAIRDFQPDGLLRLTDDEVADAAGATASTFETAARGVIYEHQTSSVLAARLGSAIGEAVSALPQARGSAFERDVAAALRAVERGAREARKSFGGDPTAYLALVTRLLGRSDVADAQAGQSAERTSGLIIP